MNQKSGNRGGGKPAGRHGAPHKDGSRNERRDDRRDDRRSGKPGGGHGGGDGGGHRSGGRHGNQRGGNQRGGNQRGNNSRGGERGGNAIRARGFWLHGLHAAAEALNNPRRRIHRIIVTENGLEALQPALDRAAKAGMGRPMPEVFTGGDFAEKVADAPGHNGIALDAEPLGQPDLPTLIEKLPAEGRHCLLILDQVTDPHNIGAIIRSAAAFGAVAVVAQDRNAPEETAIMTKTASGGMEHMPYVKVTNISRTLTWLKEHDFLSIGLDERGETTLAGLPLPDRVAFVLGAEGDGMRRLVTERCDRLVRLPTLPPIYSLNVSNAAATTLYEWCRI